MFFYTAHVFVDHSSLCFWFGSLALQPPVAISITMKQSVLRRASIRGYSLRGWICRYQRRHINRLCTYYL